MCRAACRAVELDAELTCWRVYPSGPPKACLCSRARAEPQAALLAVLRSPHSADALALGRQAVPEAVPTKTLTHAASVLPRTMPWFGSSACGWSRPQNSALLSLEGCQALRLSVHCVCLLCAVAAVILLLAGAPNGAHVWMAGLECLPPETVQGTHCEVARSSTCQCEPGSRCLSSSCLLSVCGHGWGRPLCTSKFLASIVYLARRRNKHRNKTEDKANRKAKRWHRNTITVPLPLSLLVTVTAQVPPPTGSSPLHASGAQSCQSI